jgi:hypothetical protein
LRIWTSNPSETSERQGPRLPTVFCAPVGRGPSFWRAKFGILHAPHRGKTRSIQCATRFVECKSGRCFAAGGAKRETLFQVISSCQRAAARRRAWEEDTRCNGQFLALSFGRSVENCAANEPFSGRQGAGSNQLGALAAVLRMFGRKRGSSDGLPDDSLAGAIAAKAEEGVHVPTIQRADGFAQPLLGDMHGVG